MSAGFMKELLLPFWNCEGNIIGFDITDFSGAVPDMPDNCTVVLNFVKFPEEEFDLLVKIINYLGKSDLGVYKVVLD